MAQSGAYKQYSRGTRNIILEESFNGGMFSDNIPLDGNKFKHIVNFNVSDVAGQLVPRRGKVADTEISTDSCETALLIPPTEATTLGIYNVRYNAVEGGEDELVDAVRKFIITCPNESYAQRSTYTAVYHNMFNTMPDGNRLSSYYTSKTSLPIYVAATEEIKPIKPSATGVFPDYYCKVIEGPWDSKSNAARISVLSKMDTFKPRARLVGASLDNNLYTFAYSEDGNKLVRFVPLPTTPNRTYNIETIVPKEIDSTYANNYGFNMLSTTPYSFNNKIGTWELNSLLPYEDEACTKLLFSYNTGQKVYFKVTFNYAASSTVNVKVSKKLNSEDSWELLPTDKTITSTATECPPLIIPIVAPSESFSLRVELSNTSNIVLSSNDYPCSGGSETGETYGTTKGLSPATYDLTTATGMLTWKQRLVLWGIDKAPNMLFCSDINNATYFPYPNCCEIYNDNILYVCIFMDSLLIFTPENIYKTTLNTDGSFKTECVAADVRLTYDDMYSVVPVKNMLFYKSDNYYYMLVPSNKALTFGELNVAPVSSPINYMLDHMDIELKRLLISMYGEEWNYPDVEDLILEPHTYQTYLANNDVCLDFRFIVSTKDRTVDKLKISYVLKYSTTLRTWTSELYYTPFSSIQMYAKNVAGVPRYITYTTNNVDTAIIATSTYIEGSSLYCLNINGGTIAQDNGTLYSTDTKIFIDESYPESISFKDNVVNYTIKPHILTDDIDGTIDNYATSDLLKNKQYIDTGYKNFNVSNKKRFRELQFKINNKLAIPITFKTGFIIDGDRRVKQGSYTLTPTEDGTQLITIPTAEQLVTGVTEFEDDNTYNDNVFALDNASLSVNDVATVRWKVSGKGYAPRLTLLSENEKSYELHGLCWVARPMNAR